MNLILTRQPPVGNAVRGSIKLHRGSDPACSYGATTRSSSACSFEKQSESRSPASNGIPSSAVPASSSSLRSGMPTLENAAYLIPPGTYRIAVTYSPRFKRPLPLVCDVIGAPDDPNRPRSGIRFHRGTRPEHSRGSILFRTTAEVDYLCDFITSHAPVTLKIING